jgi:tetratricopeptide (TPR) repeat protein
MSKFTTLVVLIIALAIPAWADATNQPATSACAEIETGISAQDECAHEMVVQKYSAAIQTGELSGKKLSRAFSRRAIAHAQLRKYERAIEDFTQALVLDPVNSSA